MFRPPGGPPGPGGPMGGPPRPGGPGIPNLPAPPGPGQPPILVDGKPLTRMDIERMRNQAAVAHKTGLPEKVLRMFAPRPPLVYAPPITKKRPRLTYTGIAAYVDNFAGPGDPEFEPPPKRDDLPETRIFRNLELPLQARIETDSKPERVLRKAKERTEQSKTDIEEKTKAYEPAKDAKAEGDPFKTLFIGRLSYDASERKLKREFEEFGPVKRVRIVTDESGKPRGYAFIEFEHKNDMKNAYKMADGRKIEGRRMLVDVERGRTVPNWRPRRLAGGKGGESRLPREPKKQAKKLLARLIEERLRAAATDRGEAPTAAPRDEEDEQRARDRAERDERDKRERDERERRDKERERASSHRDRRDDRYRDDRRRERSRERHDDRKRGRDRDDDRYGKRYRDDDRGRRERDR